MPTAEISSEQTRDPRMGGAQLRAHAEKERARLFEQLEHAEADITVSESIIWYSL